MPWSTAKHPTIWLLCLTIFTSLLQRTFVLCGAGGYTRLLRSVVLLAAACTVFGCKDDPKPPSGKLVIATQTDMSVPGGLDEIRVRVTTADAALVDERYELAPQGDSKIPFTLTVEAASADGEITIAIVGLKDSEPLVFAEAITRVPRDRTALLGLPLQYLCLGSAKKAGDYFASTCDDVKGEPAACVAGTCAASRVRESSLPDFDPGDVFGGASGPDMTGACFETQSCFTVAEPVTPDSDCVVHLEVPEDREPNIALVLSEESTHGSDTGICGDRGCLVPLQQDARFGYELATEALDAQSYAASLALPKAVCEALTGGSLGGLLASYGCQTKTSKVPTCGPWSSAARTLTVALSPLQPDEGGDAGASEDAGEPGVITVEIFAVNGWDGGPVAVGQVIELALAGVDPDAVVVWASSDESVATVDANGRVVIVGTGRAVITATVDGVVVEWAIDVPVTTIVVPWHEEVVGLMLDPASLTLPVGASAQVTARGTLERGSTLDATTDAEWQTGDSDVATVEGGLVRAVGPGETFIVASLNGVSAEVTVTVTEAALELLVVEPSYVAVPAGLSVQLRATGVYDDGSSLDVTASVVWSSLDPGVADVDDRGLVTALSRGDAFVVAELDGEEGETHIHVTDGELVGLLLEPRASTLLVGQSRTFSAWAAFSDGQTLDVSTLAAWSSSNGAVTSTNGPTARALAPGRASIWAEFQGETATADVTVRDARLVSVAVAPGEVSLPAGGRTRFTAEATFEDGTSADVTDDVEWTVENAAVGTVLTGGTFLAGAKGTVRVLAKLGQVTGSATVTVTDATLVGLVASPEEVTLVAGHTAPLRVLASFSDGSSLDVTALASWVADSAVASVNSAGVLRGNRAGTTVVGASFGGASAVVSVTVTNAELVAIVVVAPQTTAPVGQNIALSAEASYSDGTTVDATRTVVWSTSAVEVATVDAAGLLTARAPGRLTVMARLGAINGRADLEITDAVLTDVVVSPATLSLAKGTTGKASLLALYSDGSSRAPTSGVTWNSATPAVATARDGTITGVGTGNTRVTGSFGGYSAALDVTVTNAVPTALTVTPAVSSAPKGTRVPFTAVMTYSDGTSSSVTNVTWRSLTPNTASVDSSGVAFASNAGLATIQGTSGALSHSASFEVTPASVDQILVTPAEESTPVGRSVGFVATAVMTDGTQVPASNVTWTSSNIDVASVSASGEATGRKPGQVTITATSGGKSNTAVLRVTDATITGLQLAPATPTLPSGGTLDFVVNATYSDGSVRNDVAATFTSSNTQVLVIDSASGFARGANKGEATVTASFSGQSTSTRVSVSDAVVTSVSVSPESATVPVGQTTTLRADANYSDGRTVDVTSQATWTADPAGNASVQAGIVTGRRTGPTTITATFGGKAAAAQVRVTDAVVVAVEIEAETTTLPLGRSTQLQARATYSDGSSKVVTSDATWSRSAGTSVSVNAGLVTAIALGTSTVAARFGNISATVGITVTNAVITGLSITPLKASVIVGNSVNFTATATYSDNTFQLVTGNSSWSTSNGQIASVSLGVATGVSAGTVEVRASYQGHSAAAELAVVAASVTRVDVTGDVTTLPVGRTLQLRATAVYNNGTSVDVTTQASWRSSNTQVAAVETGASGGRVRGVASGNATILAAFGGREGSLAIAVSRAVLDGIRITPSALTVVERLRGNFVLQASYSDGSNQDVTSNATWTSRDTSVATFPAPGVVQAGKVGTADVQADFGGFSAFALVTVTSPTAVRLSVDPAVVTLPAGTATPVRVTVHWSNDTTSDVTTAATWTTSNARVATVSADKRSIQAGSTQGPATLTATYLTVSGTSAVTVAPPSLTRLTVTPSTASITQRQTVALTATATLSDGTTANWTSLVRWTSGNTNVATVSAAGVVTGIAASATPVSVSADYDGTVASASITVSAPRLTSVTVEPAQFSVEVNKTVRLAAFANYDNGDKVDVTSKSVWTSADTKVIGFNGAGIAQGINAGATLVTAEFEKVTGTASASVTAAPIVRIDISPGQTTVLLDNTIKLQARGFDAAGAYVGDLSEKVTWTADDKYVKVNASGTVTGIAVGQGSIKATFEQLTATATVNVNGVERLAIIPSDRQVIVGVPAALAAVALMTDQTVVDVSTKVEWASSSELLPIDRTGTIVAQKAGDASVTATLGKTSTKASVVAVEAQSYLEIVPNVLRLTRDASETIQVFLVSGRERVNVTANSVLATGDSKVASVSNGRAGATVTGVGVGGTLLQATYDKLSAVVPVSVATTRN